MEGAVWLNVFGVNTIGSGEANRAWRVLLHPEKPAETSLPHAATRALAATPSPMTSGTVACAQGLRGLGGPGVGEGGPAEVIRPRRPDKRNFRRHSSPAVRSGEVVWLQMQPRTLSG